MKHPTREMDERIVLACQLRAKGATYGQIARRTGIKRNNIATLIGRVYAADLKECAFWGDTPAEVKAGY